MLITVNINKLIFLWYNPNEYEKSTPSKKHWK
jgi:hypothetical protein